jgi:outer membrane protein OmpA-like peptidoglycan-associated protein
MKSQLATMCAAALGLVACASTPKSNPVLDSARATVQSAESDPNVNQFAAVDLDNARKELAAADQANAQRKIEDVNQHAYLAAQMARIAQVHGAAKADDARVANGRVERDRIQLEARTREVSNAQAQTAEAVAQRDQFKAELDQLKATQTSRGIVLTLGDVLFDTGKSELKSGGSRKLEQLAQFLRDHPNRRVQIEGFTDSVGSDSYNEGLSQRRADAVKAALVSHGIDAGRIGTQGYGKAFPVAGNADSGGRQLNRRVEVVIAAADNAEISPRT